MLCFGWGAYTLTGEDILQGRSFPDSIARGSFPIDIHDPAGKALNCPDNGKAGPPSPAYDIPYRVMLGGLGNLLVTGRCISAAHEALASVRITASAMALGQAAGTAAALAVRGQDRVDFRTLEPGHIQRELIKQGASVSKAFQSCP